MGNISRKIAEAMPPSSSDVTKMWEMVDVATKYDDTVTGDLLRQRMKVFQRNKDMYGDYANFIESVEAMARGTGKILRDLG